jgi:type IV pilus assembly protein PilC
MTLYAYKALNEQGKTVRGLQDAANLIDLEQHLKRGKLDLVSAREDETPSLFGVRKIKRAELLNFFLNMEQLTRAQVPLLECLTDLRDSTEDPKFREIIASMVEEIENGEKLSQAMARHPQAFDKIAISLTHAGEESGRLLQVFKHLTDSLRWQDEMAANAKNIMIYPAFVASVVLGITLFLMLYLVPQLVVFIQSMGREIPLQTRMLIATSNFFVAYWYLVLLLPVAALAAFKIAVASSPQLQYQIDNLKLHVWPVGPVMRKLILARFANTFAMMYASGISVLNCIANSRDIVNNRVIATSLDQVAQEIEAGRNLTQSFQQTHMFPPLVIRMLRVGEATGELDQALLNVSYFYDRDVKDAIHKIEVMIEPVMTLILGLLLGWVMLAVLSPIYDIVSKIQL